MNKVRICLVLSGLAMVILGYAGVKTSPDVADKVLAGAVILFGVLIEFAVILTIVQVRDGSMTITRDAISAQSRVIGEGANMPMWTDWPQLPRPDGAYAGWKELNQGDER